MKNVLLVDQLACLGAANNTAMAMGILKDGIHLKGTNTAKDQGAGCGLGERQEARRRRQCGG